MNIYEKGQIIRSIIMRSITQSCHQMTMFQIRFMRYHHLSKSRHQWQMDIDISESRCEATWDYSCMMCHGRCDNSIYIWSIPGQLVLSRHFYHINHYQCAILRRQLDKPNISWHNYLVKLLLMDVIKQSLIWSQYTFISNFFHHIILYVSISETFGWVFYSKYRLRQASNVDQNKGTQL